MKRSIDNVAPELSGLTRAVRLAGLSIREYRLWPGYVFPMHAHCRLGFVFATAGRFTAEMDGVPFDVENGRGLILPGQELHCETAGALGATCLLIESERQGRAEDFSRPRGIRLRRSPDTLRAAVEAAFDPGGSVPAGHFFTDLVSLLRESYRDANRGMPHWLHAAWRNTRLDPEAWTVATLAASAGVAPETMCRSFVRFFGTTPSETLRANKLEKAALHLLTTERSISSVAFDTGFTDQSHLTNRFARRFGITPGELRRRHASSTASNPYKTE